MPSRDPSAVQLDFPLLVAELIEQLQLTGTVGLLNFIPEVRPIFIVGSRPGAPTVTSSPIIYLPAEVFDTTVLNPVANTIFADTGPLPAGDYDVIAYGSVAATAVVNPDMLELEHRDAANAVSVSSWWVPSLANSAIIGRFEFALTLALNERLRFRNNQAATGRIAATIMIKLRPVP